MLELMVLAFLLSLDSFRVSIGLGTAGLGRAVQRQIALSFALCDALAPLAGLVLGRSLAAAVGSWSEPLGVLVIAGYALFVLVVGYAPGPPARPPARAWVVIGLPLSLSLDNFLAGAALGLLPVPLPAAALVLGAASGLLALAGLRLGDALAGVVPVRAELLGATVLLIVAAVHLAELI
jgi:manganese efflux pump family protein